MAIDVYLQIDGIKGESRDERHSGWIECKSVQWAAFQPRSATSSTGGGHTAERGELSDITVTKLSDLATPILLQNCMMGRTMAKARIEFQRADSNGVPIRYFEIELENVLIAHISPSITEGDVLTETVALKFSKVKWRYTQQAITGGACGNTSGGWCCASNRVAA